MTRPRVLIVEDHEGIAQSLRTNLEIDGYVVEHAADGARAIAACTAAPPDLVILDLMLPRVDGFEVLRTLRERGIEAPVLILSARGAEAEKVRGFRLGADDYVTKPFGLMELLARIGALLRRHRTPPSAAPTTFAFGDVVVDTGSRSVTRRGADVVLRPKEYDLLVALLHRAGNVVSKEQLLRDVWGYRDGVVSRTVDTHLLELRRKLEDDPAHPRHLQTLRGAGYVLRVA